MTKARYASIGEVSSGTLRSEDLVSAFCWELETYLKRLRMTREQRKRFRALVRDANALDFGDEGPEEASDIIGELEDALNELAPPYAYFGTAEGDGACFGFWPIVDDDELPKIAAGDVGARLVSASPTPRRSVARQRRCIVGGSLNAAPMPAAFSRTKKPANGRCTA